MLVWDAERPATRTFALNLNADLPKLAHFSGGLLQPVGHTHFAVHFRRGGEVLLGLRGIPSAAIELAESNVAMGNDWAHAAGLSEG